MKSIERVNVIMKFDFRKMMCGTIALVMTLSSFVCVQTVSAETQKVDWSMTDYSSWQDSDGKALSNKELSNGSLYHTTKDGYTLYYHAGDNDIINDSNSFKMGGGGSSNFSSGRYFYVDMPSSSTLKISAKAQTHTSNDYTAGVTYEFAGGESKTTSQKTNTSTFTDFSIKNEAEKTQTLYFTFAAKQYIQSISLSVDIQPYDVTLKVVDAESGAAIPAQTFKESATSADLIAIPVEGKQFNITTLSETFHVGNPELGYITTAVNVNKAGEVVVKLNKIPTPKDGNYFNTSIFYPEDPMVSSAPAEGEKRGKLYNLDISNYTANGYTVSKATVQMFDSSNKLQKRIQISGKETIKYTPSVKGKLVINAASSSKKYNRGYTIAPAPLQGDTEVNYPANSNSDPTEKDFILEAGKEYVITVKEPTSQEDSSGTINIYDISFTPLYDITLSGNNDTGSSQTIKVNNKTMVADAGNFSGTIESLEAGDYDLSISGDGYVIYPRKITVGEGSTDFENISIKKAVNLDIKVKGTAANDINITVDGKSPSSNITDDTGVTYKFSNVAEGIPIEIYFDNTGATQIVGWSNDFDPNSKTESNSFIYTLPEGSSSHVLEFTSDEDALSNLSATTYEGDENAKLPYGNYGYGEFKGTQPGAVKAETVPALNSVSGVVTLRDYIGGYSDSDARLILNKNQKTGVSFQVAGDGFLTIDISGTYEIKKNGEVLSDSDLQDIGTSGKKGFKVAENDTITVHSGDSRSLTKASHLKSIRYVTEGNIFEKSNVEEVSQDSLTEDTQITGEAVDTSADYVFVRVIGKLDASKIADINSVIGVGILIIDKEKADGYKDEFGAFMPSNYTSEGEGVNEVNKTINLYETVLFDGVYDGTTAKKSEDEEPKVDYQYTQDTKTGSGFGDEVYYMLRHINVPKGSYYFLPYTRVKSNLPENEKGYDDVFDNGNITDTATLNSYLQTFE